MPKENSPVMNRINKRKLREDTQSLVHSSGLTASS